jgi:RNA polymerase-interacting CarD/CdnL/TRCF family regulator
MASELYPDGTMVVLARNGLARVRGRSEREIHGVRSLCYELERHAGTAVIPIENAPAVLRLPVPAREAEAMLEALRGPAAASDSTLNDPEKAHALLLAERSPQEDAALLRAFYALEAPLSMAARRAIFHLEDVVLGEIAFVLRLSEKTLEAEMRASYPATAVRSPPPGY